jgi:hypothetical protein
VRDRAIHPRIDEYDRTRDAIAVRGGVRRARVHEDGIARCHSLE